MHACGHDLHTAGLVGAARLLAAHREEIPGSIIFMFQPAEEVEGGAEPMIAEGVLEAAGVPVVAAYGIHVEADVRGRFTTKGGPLMAGFADLNLTIHGAGGHSSQPQATRDPVPALAEVVLALNTMTGRSFDIFDPVVVSVTQLEAAQASNVIPDSAKLTASIRFLSAESLALLQERVTEIAENIARAHRCTVEVDFQVGFPVTVNNPAESAAVLERLGSVFGSERVVEMEHPRMGSEDFSFVLAEECQARLCSSARRPRASTRTPRRTIRPGWSSTTGSLAIRPRRSPTWRSRGWKMRRRTDAKQWSQSDTQEVLKASDCDHFSPLHPAFGHEKRGLSVRSESLRRR
jgi:amidohydrolase